MATMTTSGIVQAVSGIVTAVAADGSERILQIGDMVFSGEEIVTGAAGTISIDYNGENVELARSSRVMLSDSEVALAVSPEGAKEEVQVFDELASVQSTVNETVFDPNALSVTEAGTSSGYIEDEGSSAVDVAYSASSETPDSGFDTNGATNTSSAFANGPSQANGVPDDAPIAVDDSFTMDEDPGTFVGHLETNDTESIDGVNTWTVETHPSHGSVTIFANGTFLYTPDANYNGVDSFTYRITDTDTNI